MSKDPASTRVIQTVEKSSDLECHLRVVEIEGVNVVEMRDYIPSLQEYGRGYWLPLRSDVIFSLINGLTDVARAEEI